jgi:hypothetical protein
LLRLLSMPLMPWLFAVGVAWCWWLLCRGPLYSEIWSAPSSPEFDPSRQLQPPKPSERISYMCKYYIYILLRYIYTRTCIPTYLSIYLSIRPSIDPSIHVSIYPSIHVSIYPSICLSVYLPIYLPTYLSI